MIDKQKILIYKKYEGDIDAWARIATSEEKENMSDADWYLIDELIQNTFISEARIISELNKKIKDKDAIDEILGIAGKYKQKLYPFD